ncbi:MAG: NAD(P)H-hydrate dehydratase [Oscillospiraceae bacterium]|nr:NAD(P)H-hydrate dehydratase [Oscillospiraceae bacterium]
MKEITKADISLPKRKEDTHKGDYGKVLLLCGSEKYTGAAYFAASAAVNTGSGLVFLSVPKKIRPTLASKLNEPILLDRKNIRGEFDAVLCGCGLGTDKKNEKLVRRVLSGEFNCPKVLDADAITIMHRSKLLPADAKHPTVLTPHEGEFSRLVPEFSHERRFEFAENFAKKNGCILVLKGNRTITATPSGELFINTSGNPGMAKGGSGDVLSGIIVSLLGQGIQSDIAAYTGVWLHGAAGDLASKNFGEYSMTPTDMLKSLKTVICEVTATE